MIEPEEVIVATVDDEIKRMILSDDFVGVDADYPCMGGCGAIVGHHQRCRPCATEAVYIEMEARRAPKIKRPRGRPRK